MSKTIRTDTPGQHLSDGEALLLLVLHLLSEMNLRLDPEDDGSAISGRAMGVLGGWRELGARPKQIARLRRLVARAEPLLARTARPLTPPPR